MDLNLLKVANTMSHPLSKPPVCGQQSGLSSGQMEMNPGSIFTSRTTSGGRRPPAFPPPLRFRPGMVEATLDEDIDGVLDLSIGEAEDGVPPWRTGTTTYPTSSTSSSSLDWLHICKKNIKDLSEFESPSARLSPADPGSQASNKDSRMSPDPRDHEESVPDRSSRSRNILEVATNILQRYDLDKDDLDQLLFYREDQVTSESLPFILHKISIEKKQKKSGVQSEPPSRTGLSAMDRRSEGVETVQEEMSSTGPKPNEGGYSGPVGESSGNRSVLLLDSTKTLSPSGDPPQRLMQRKISDWHSLWDQRGSETGLSSVALSAEPTQSNPDSQAVLPPLSLGNQDRNPVKFAISSKETKAGGLLRSKTQPSNSPLHGSGSGSSELISGNHDTCAEVQIQESKVPRDQLRSTLPKPQIKPHVNPPEPKTVSVQSLVIVPQPIPAPESPVQVPGPPSSRESPAKGDVSKGLPTRAVTGDPTGATAVRFLHAFYL